MTRAACRPNRHSRRKEAGMGLPALGTRRSRTPRRRAVRPPTLEALEGRQLLSTALAPEMPGTRLLADPASYAPDHILVRFRPGVAVAPGASPVAGTTVAQRLDADAGLYQVRLAPGTSVAGSLTAYRAD